MTRVLELVQPCDFQARHGVATERPGVVHCRGCDRDVHDLSAMTSAEASQLLALRRPDQCVRFSTDENNRIQLADGPSGLIGRIARDARPMISVASLLLAACGGEPGDESARGESSGRGEPSATMAVVTETATATASPALPTTTEPASPEASATATGSCRPMASSSISPRPVAGRPARAKPAPTRLDYAGYF